jgi:hypothetical protein
MVNNRTMFRQLPEDRSRLWSATVIHHDDDRIKEDPEFFHKPDKIRIRVISGYGNDMFQAYLQPRRNE